jgi:TPP-dependent pyruvate/acetoin dehydrogenase alpha subunit
MQQPPCPRTRLQHTPGSLSERLYAQMLLIRRFEELLLQLFEQGELFGTTHCYIGQEANAVGLIPHLERGDVIFSNHRCHGHFIAWSDRPELLLAEIMGRAAGVVGGRGGSQHVCYQGFYSNGVQGGIVPGAVGMAMAEKHKKTNKIATVFIGDGTLGEGLVYECLNMASLWGAPVLFVVEDNHWAQSTPRHRQLAGDILARGRAFGIDASQIDSTDVEAIHAHTRDLVAQVRARQRPHFAVLHTYRLCHHSKSDDARPEDEIAARRLLDPIPLQRARIDAQAAANIEESVEERLQQILAWAREQPFPDPKELAR